MERPLVPVSQFLHSAGVAPLIEAVQEMSAEVILAKDSVTESASARSQTEEQALPRF